MSEDAIDSENISKSASDPAKPKGARKPCKQAKPAKRRAGPRRPTSTRPTAPTRRRK